MGLRSLSKLRKNKEEIIEVIECNQVICGPLNYSLLLYLHLPEKENCLHLIDRVINKNDLTLLGPSTVRGNSVNELIVQAGFTTTELDSAPAYYKDMKYRLFSQRGKPEPLLAGEDFFVSNGFEIQNPFETELTDGEEFIKTVLAKSKQVSITEINHKEDHLILSCSDGTQIKCKYLYWGHSPLKLIDLIDGEIDENFTNFSSKNLSSAHLYVNMTFKEEIESIYKTIFLPLSYTNPLGHFIGDIKNVGEGKQSINFLHIFDKEESNEDEVSKRVRTRKRTLEKIYPNVLEKIESEQIILQSDGHEFNITDNLYKESQFKESYPRIKIFGEHAPVEHNLPEEESLVGAARALLSIRSLIKDNQE